MAAPTEGVMATAAESYMEAVQAASVEALARAGCVERHLELGGASIHCRFAGSALLPSVEPALQHRIAQASRSVDLTITIWDEASTSVGLPRSDGRVGCLVRGHLPALSDEGIDCAYEQNYGGLFMLRAATKQAFFFAPDAPLPTYERAFPLRTILGWYLARRGVQLVHSGAVGTGDAAVLLTGKGGSGKSNTTLACVEAGMSYFGDDYVGVSEDGEAPGVHGIFRSAKVFAGDEVSFPRLGAAAALGDSIGDTKSLFFLDPAVWPLERTKRIKAILLPRVAHRAKTEWQPAAAMDALKAISFSTLAQRPASNQCELSAMARLARRVPSYWLHLGTDRREVAATVRRFMEDTP